MAQHVVFLVLDGARIEETLGDAQTWGQGWSDAYDGPTAEIMPNTWAQLVPVGAQARPGFVTGVTLTFPAHNDLFTGARQQMGNYPNPSGPEFYRPDLPTFFEQARLQLDLDASQVVIASNTNILQGLEHSAYPGLGESLGGMYDLIGTTGDDGQLELADDPAVLDSVRDHLQGGARLVFANLHDIDRTGHAHPEQQTGAIREVDQPIAELWEWMQSDESGLQGDSMLVLTSDHGRHRFVDNETPWQHHDCHCSGCREIPMLLLGTGILPGAVAGGPHILEDLGQTLAWSMGFDMPYGTGLVMSDILQGVPAVENRSGQVSVRLSGDLLAWQEWRDTPGSRSEARIGGEVFADPGAIHVEEPRVLQAGGVNYACWRQVSVGGDEQYWTWQARCQYQEGASWMEMGFPEEVVWPHFSPAMTLGPEGDLLLAFADDPATDDGASFSGSHSVIRVLRWSAATGWDDSDEGADSIDEPTQPSIAVLDGTVFVAFAGSDNYKEGRYTRHVEVHQVSWSEDGTSAWEPVFQSGTYDSEENKYGRMERPVLGTTEDRLQLAIQAYGNDGTSLLTTSYDTSSGEWSAVVPADKTGLVFGHLSASWSEDGSLYWARLSSDDEVEICRLAAEDASVDCHDTGAAYIDSLAVSGQSVWASLADDPGTWEAREINW